MDKIAIKVVLLSGRTKSPKNKDLNLIEFLDKAESECAKALSSYLTMFEGLPFAKQLFVSLQNNVSRSPYDCILYYTGIESVNGYFVAHFDEL
jgi:hypothetical protein